MGYETSIILQSPLQPVERAGQGGFFLESNTLETTAHVFGLTKQHSQVLPEQQRTTGCQC